MSRVARSAALTWLAAALGWGQGMAAAAPPATTEDGQWTMPSKDYAATRFSALGDISAQNARSLHPVWTFSTGVLGGHEGQPLVVGDTMYVVTPWPNVLYAFDLTREGYPLKWKYRPEVSANALGVACCDSVNRGAFYADGKIIYNLLDGHTVAVDARSGHEVWKTQIADLGNGETTTMAPLVVRDRVIVGAAGGEFGIYGWVKGLELSSGRIAWSARNLGTDDEMRARADTFRPPYEHGADLGAHSWISSITAPAIHRPTTRSNGRATTSGAPASWLGGRRTAHSCGPISSHHTTTGTTTQPARWCWPI